MWDRLWRVVVVVVLVLACSRPGPSTIDLNVGYFPTQDFLPYFVITEQGFDRRHDLRLIEKMFPGGAGVIDAIVDGKVDVGPAVGTVPILAAAAQGVIPDKVTVIAGNNFTDPQHPSIGVIVGPTIQRWKISAGSASRSTRKPVSSPPRSSDGCGWRTFAT